MSHSFSPKLPVSHCDSADLALLYSFPLSSILSGSFAPSVLMASPCATSTGNFESIVLDCSTYPFSRLIYTSYWLFKSSFTLLAYSASSSSPLLSSLAKSSSTLSNPSDFLLSDSGRLVISLSSINSLDAIATAWCMGAWRDILSVLQGPEGGSWKNRSGNPTYFLSPERVWTTANNCPVWVV